MATILFFGVSRQGRWIAVVMAGRVGILEAETGREVASLECAARAVALLTGRDFVMPDDVKDIALATLRHRIALAPELEIEGHDIDTVLTAILDKVEVPKE